MQRTSDVLLGNGTRSSDVGDTNKEIVRGKSKVDVKSDSPANVPSSTIQDDAQSDYSGTMKFSNTVFQRGRAESDVVSVDSTQEVRIHPVDELNIWYRLMQH